MVLTSPCRILLSQMTCDITGCVAKVMLLWLPWKQNCWARKTMHYLQSRNNLRIHCIPWSFTVNDQQGHYYRYENSSFLCLSWTKEDCHWIMKGWTPMCNQINVSSSFQQRVYIGVTVWEHESSMSTGCVQADGGSIKVWGYFLLEFARTNENVICLDRYNRLFAALYASMLSWLVVMLCSSKLMHPPLCRW